MTHNHSRIRSELDRGIDSRVMPPYEFPESIADGSPIESCPDAERYKAAFFAPSDERIRRLMMSIEHSKQLKHTSGLN